LDYTPRSFGIPYSSLIICHSSFAFIPLATGPKSRLQLDIMSTVGEQLRNAREAQKLSVHQIADITKIRTDHVRAIEEGNYSVFSAPVYIRGFVRTYATIVKLDVPQVMAALDAELGQDKKFREPPPISGPPRGVLDFFMLQLSKLDWRKSLIGLGALAVILIAGSIFLIWRHYRTADPLVGLKPGIYQSTQTVSGETLPLPAPKR
jgi:cytoskeletal protein RodZ